MPMLFACYPQRGHVHPLFPLAQSVSDAGHEVRFASGASVLDRIERAGLATVPVAPHTVEAPFEVLAGCSADFPPRPSPGPEHRQDKLRMGGPD